MVNKRQISDEDLEHISVEDGTLPVNEIKLTRFEGIINQVNKPKEAPLFTEIELDF